MAEPNYAPFPVPAAPPGGESKPRRRPVSRWLAALVLVATILLAVVALVANHAASERDAAVATQAQAARALASARQSAAAASQLLQADHRLGTTIDAKMTAIAATEAELTQLHDQDVAAQTAVVHAAESGSIATFNAAVDRANAILDRYDAAVDRYNEQIAGLP